MPTTFHEGDLVQIADREPTAADVKSQLFYPHYRSVRGVLSKLYPDGTALVIADGASLPGDVRARHDSGTTAMRQKWLDGLSDEGRNRLTAAEKKFALRYSVLVSQLDLRPAGSVPEAAALVQSAASVPAEAAEPGAEASPRKSLEDIEADEDRHLSEMRRQKSRG